MRERLDTYSGYSVGSAVVWAVILLLARRFADSETRSTVRLVCGGWWMGWTSASIARIGYPPAKPLSAAGEERLRVASLALVALGLASTIRALFAGRRGRKPSR